ncbi:uncharacterized protein MKK02DRAFT_43074 [Dioszegia hungarica]|uniref:Uncharacterized protein n=1 Tax=Dioszegia hungarica TaxID=4972 RepID=A0AA38HCE5_9TREE|nr:uncharacterized protein MKK02DRAFT_43074 [Dioszegia hungarica]KAI9638672.1 hypothetical protein MKK02DRAFT_43074 [Dioszegia hungarica]
MFKDMFGGVAVGPKEIHLPIAGRYIDLFIRALYPDRPPVRHNIIQTKETIELLLRYDCIVPAQRFLYLQCKWLERSELYDALVLASRLDHLPSACRIIPLGYKWYRDQPGEGLPLCPNSGKRPWSVEDAARLQPGWVWALTMASNTCQKRLSEDMEQAKEETRRPAYWRNVLGEFMANLAQ